MDEPIRRQPREPALSEAPSRAQKLFVVGGVLGAVAASSCCVLPLALFGLGVSGAWIGNLTALAPYQPYFLAFALLCLCSGYWLSRRSRRTACASGAACAGGASRRLVTFGMAAAAALVAGAVALEFIGPFLLAS